MVIVSVAPGICAHKFSVSGVITIPFLASESMSFPKMGADMHASMMNKRVHEPQKYIPILYFLRDLSFEPAVCT